MRKPAEYRAVFKASLESELHAGDAVRWIRVTVELHPQRGRARRIKDTNLTRAYLIRRPGMSKALKCIVVSKGDVVPARRSDPDTEYAGEALVAVTDDGRSFDVLATDRLTPLSRHVCRRIRQVIQKRRPAFADHVIQLRELKSAVKSVHRLAASHLDAVDLVCS